MRVISSLKYFRNPKPEVLKYFYESFQKPKTGVFFHHDGMDMISRRIRRKECALSRLEDVCWPCLLPRQGYCV
jgi:hypothetical protein